MARARVVIVGASLVGMVLALACARRGMPAVIFERTRAADRSGGALGINTQQIFRTIGVDPLSESDQLLPILRSNRAATSWLALHDWLRRLVDREDLVKLEEAAVVEVVSLASRPSVLLADGREILADVVVGADGYRSTVRRAIVPDAPFARYAGYMLWRGLVDERELANDTPWPSNEDGLGVIDASGYRLIAYPVPGRDGSVRRGERQISFAWYDTNRQDLLLKSGSLAASGHVLGTLKTDQMTASLRDELSGLAQKHWPMPWRSAVLHAIEQKTLFATPISEYLPKVLTRNNAVMIGDAAHVVSPMTGRGFSTGVDDARVLASLLGDTGSAVEAHDALIQFEVRRLPVARQLVFESMRWSDAYVRIHGQHRAGSDNA
jgi:2-polyprenyl-6-methoxyphenol hydroxylase-like FAD-dependent oxidoreductase